MKVGTEPIAFLGPLVVESEERHVGLGVDLAERACEAARAAGEGAVLLLGEESFFGRMDFVVAHQVIMAGLVNPNWVLVRTLRDLDLSGPVSRR